MEINPKKKYIYIYIYIFERNLEKKNYNKTTNNTQTKCQ